LFPAALENPAALAFLARAAQKYPANDFVSVGDNYNTAGYRFIPPTGVTQNQDGMRLVYNFNKSHQLHFRTTVEDDLNQGEQWLPDTPHPTRWNHPWGFVINHTWTLGSNKVNNFRYGLTRQAYSILGDAHENAIIFRGIFRQFAYSPTLS